jgi:hypothetical protein
VQVYSASHHYHSTHFNSDYWYWKKKGFTRETANLGSKCCAQWPAVFHKYTDLTFYHEIYEGEGAVGPDGYFDTARLQLEQIVRMEVKHRSVKKGHALDRVSRRARRVSVCVRVCVCV